MTTLQEKIAVMQAFAEGKAIEASHDYASWFDPGEPNWNWNVYYYRIKREPREFYLVSRPQMVGLQVCEADGGVPGDALSCILVREVID